MAIDGKRVLAIIPARGGSKRFPGKNLAMFHGKPLVVHAVNQALACRYVDTVVVSSDSEEILALIKPPAIALPRPAALSTDDSPTEDTIKHALSFFPHDLFVLLQPTSPTRLPADIDLTIATAPLSPFGKAHTTSNNSSPFGLPNGAAYASSDTTFRYGPLHHLSTPVWTPKHRSHDINSPEDLILATKAQDER